MRLTDVLAPEAVIVPLAGRDKQSAITELVDQLHANGQLLDRDAVLRAVLQREQTRTTGIGQALAVPHGKTSGVRSLVLAVGKCAEPIDFQSIDGKGVSVIFLMVSPLDAIEAHIQVLAHIGRVYNLDAFRRKLLAASSASDLYSVITAQEQSAV